MVYLRSFHVQGRTTLQHTRRNLVAFLMLFALVLGVAACGDDDDSEEASGDDTTTTSEPADEGDEGDGPPEGPPEVNPCAEGVTPEEAGLPPAEEPAEGATAIDVTAKDYEFEGAEALDAGGSFAITLTNEGTELHEMAIVKLADEETPLEELLASDEEPETTDVAFGFACPGSSTVLNADVTAPGRYVALCFIPVGTTPETDPSAFEQGGPPHAANGMVHEFTIS
jgi:hypothetical protein